MRAMTTTIRPALWAAAMRPRHPIAAFRHERRQQVIARSRLAAAAVAVRDAAECEPWFTYEPDRAPALTDLQRAVCVLARYAITVHDDD